MQQSEIKPRMLLIRYVNSNLLLMFYHLLFSCFFFYYALVFNNSKSVIGWAMVRSVVCMDLHLHYGGLAKGGMLPSLKDIK